MVTLEKGNECRDGGGEEDLCREHLNEQTHNAGKSTTSTVSQDLLEAWSECRGSLIQSCTIQLIKKCDPAIG